MCIGTPVKVIENRGFMALCEGRNGQVEVNMMLIGPQEEGTWVLNFLGSAREVLTEEDAANIDNALDGLEAIMNGAEEIDVDAHFPDISLEK
ncbi:MAG: HypC/HybG/HupF family hydrogenase formation chaperone [Methylocystaceae bacterium]|nr:HypC/HybG/HupF family hydrogenase formation chaperone [Methylocystaceae bacterium]